VSVSTRMTHSRPADIERNIARCRVGLSIEPGANGKGYSVVSEAHNDDGLGFSVRSAPPWSIASRAAEFGGTVRIGDIERVGGQVRIALPET
jgi:hypothetical protein